MIEQEGMLILLKEDKFRLDIKKKLFTVRIELIGPQIRLLDQFLGVIKARLYHRIMEYPELKENHKDH